MRERRPTVRRELSQLRVRVDEITVARRRAQTTGVRILEVAPLGDGVRPAAVIVWAWRTVSSGRSSPVLADRIVVLSRTMLGVGSELTPWAL